MADKKTFIFPPVKQETLENGLHLMLVEDHEQEGMTIALQMPFGDFCDPVALEGTAELVAGVLLKGPQALSPEEFSEKFEHAGACLFSDVGEDHSVFGCKMLSRSAGLIIPLFWDMLTKPGFRPKELNRLKKEMITSLHAELADPMSIANRHFGSVLCGNGHPVGRVQTVGSVKKINIAHITSFYESFVSPENSTIVVAGDFDSSAMAASWRGLFASWTKKPGAVPVSGGPLAPLSTSSVRLIDKPDISQMSVIVGHPVCGELEPMRNDLSLANYILGGGNFSSRLMAAIRSEQGKTYGISSQVSCSRNYGIFSTATTTQTGQAHTMLASIMKVYTTFSDSGITKEELEKAKQFAVGSMAFQLEGITNIAEKLLWLREFGRDISYFERFHERIDAMSVDTVNAAIKKYLSSPHFAIVAVGKKEEIKSVLEKYGAVKVVNFRADP
jgi:zinc protease